MIVETLPFRAEHLGTITPQPEQAAELAALTPEQARASELAGEGWSVLVDGKAVACAVLVPASDNRATVWAFIGVDAGPYMRRIFRVATAMFDHSGFRRIEAVVATGFAAGVRWMRLLGFELETPNGMKFFGSNGESYSLYARVK